MQPQHPPRVAIIGGGAAGLCAARVASRNGWTPRVFEKDPETGGVWNYQKDSDTKPMYRGLRTNLPKEIMAYREFPWTTENSGVEESYVKHSDVLEYLHKYQKEFELSQYITFEATVKQMTMLVDGGGVPSGNHSMISLGSEKLPCVKLDWEDPSSLTCKSEVFDAVFVCNGHYSKPSVPFLLGIEEHFTGNVLHSIAYDDPGKFSGQNVLCIGGRASGADLAREISFYSKHVYLSDTTCTSKNPQTLGNVTWVPKTLEVKKDGSIRFDHECVVQPTVDTIIFCSGYDYSFPFITEQSNIDLKFIPGERRVMPLFEQLWHAKYPNVAFVGLPHSVLPFPLFELQAEATHAQWSKNRNGELSHNLPSLEERLAQAALDSMSGGAKKEAGRIQDTHYLGSEQWEYCLRLAKYAGLEGEDMEVYISTNKAIYEHASKSRQELFPGGPDSYRRNRYIRIDDDVAFEVNSLLSTTQAIWEVSGSERKGEFPGGPDVYRRSLFSRDGASFALTYSELNDFAAAAA